MARLMIWMAKQERAFLSHCSELAFSLLIISTEVWMQLSMGDVQKSSLKDCKI
jgi:hypothetical protein